LLGPGSRDPRIRAYHVRFAGKAAIEIDFRKGTLPAWLARPDLRSKVYRWELYEPYETGYSFERDQFTARLSHVGPNRYLAAPPFAWEQDSVHVGETAWPHSDYDGVLRIPRSRIELDRGKYFVVVPQDSVVAVSPFITFTVPAQRAKLFSIWKGQLHMETACLRGTLVDLAKRAPLDGPFYDSEGDSQEISYVGPNLFGFGLDSIYSSAQSVTAPVPTSNRPSRPIRVGPLPPFGFRYHVVQAWPRKVIDSIVPIEPLPSRNKR
jgi:hypothetical protein